jgi:hypothetical protein
LKNELIKTGNPMTPEQDIQKQLDEIKAMWFKNIQLIADYRSAPADDKPLTKEQFEKLKWRTHMLDRIVKDVESSTKI